MKKLLDIPALIQAASQRKLCPAKPLSVGQLRVAIVPRRIRPPRPGSVDRSWLEPRLIQEPSR